VTGTLHLHLDKDLMHDRVDRAAVATIRAIPPFGAAEGIAEGRREVVLPSGGAPPLRVDLDAGRYLVEAELPSGDLVSDEVEVWDGQDAVLALRAATSPHEWLSWQHFLGKVEPIQSYRAGPPNFAVPSVRWVTPAPGDAWTSFAMAADDDAGPTLPPFETDTATWLYQVTAGGPWNEWFLPQTSPAPGTTPRGYLVVRHRRSRWLVSLPVPWTGLTTGTELPVQIMVRPRPGNDHADVTTTVRDPQIASALGFMTLGALPTAERLFDEARQMVLRKQVNPLAAAGAGYVLLGTERGAEPKEWHDWIGNLRNWFDWLPDGAIQDGWLRLRHRRSPADLDAAREALFTAYRRGLPYYSVGLQWLMDGLTLFSHHDPEAAEMLRHVRDVATRADFGEPFTILRLEQQ